MAEAAAGAMAAPSPSLPPQPAQQQRGRHRHHRVGVVHERVPGDKVHFCMACSFPVAVYARLYPCMHAYCLVCATDMDKCFICHANIARIERIPEDTALYLSPTTLQSFKAEEDLAQHTRRVYQHLKSNPTVKQLLTPEAGQSAAASMPPGPGAQAPTQPSPWPPPPPPGPALPVQQQPPPPRRHLQDLQASSHVPGIQQAPFPGFGVL